MLLIDILSEFDENKNFVVKDIHGNILSVYDGKNAIDKKYNDCNVIVYSIDSNGNGTATVTL